MIPEFADFHYSAQDGLNLHARIYGERDGDRLPVVCLPGLTRNARDFHELALMLSRDTERPRKVIAFDYRGRGGSQYDRNWKNYAVPVEAADVMAGMTALGVEKAAFIGTSRGGLIVFALAAMRPAALGAVVLNDVGPVLEGVGLAHIASYLKRSPKPKSFADAVEIQRTANAEDFPALKDEDWGRMAHAFYREEKGRPVADFDPALAKTLSEIDLNKPLPALWPQFDGMKAVPLLAIRGANSRLLAPETLEQMAVRHPGMEAVTVAGQGHAPLLETGTLPKTISAFLDRVDRRKKS